MKRRYRKLVLLFLLATTPVSLAADRQRVQQVGHGLMCICGCNQILAICNHVNCPTSGGMIKELEREIDSGKNEESILAHFVEKYGTRVLSAPPVSGFNLAAWLMPFVALVLGAAAAVYFVRRFRASWVETPATSSVDASKYQRQIEEELEKYTPED